MSSLTSVLVIGAGGIGERHLRCFQHTDRCAVAFAEPGEERRAKLQAQYGCTGFGSLRAALADRPFQAAVICTPAQTHLALAEECLSAGLHVLLEKPLATSLDGVERVRSARDASGRVVRVAYVYRSIPVVKAARAEIHSGRIGPIRHVAVESGQHFPTFRPDFRTTYYARRETGGGAIQDALTHLIHTVEWIVGPVDELACLAARQVLPDVQVEDTANLICRHADGILSSFAFNQIQVPNETVLTFHGDLGSLRVEVHRQAMGWLAFGMGQWEWWTIPHGERDAMFLAQANGFLDATAGLADELSSLEDAEQTLRVNLGALASSDHRQFVRLGGPGV